MREITKLSVKVHFSRSLKNIAYERVFHEILHHMPHNLEVDIKIAFIRHVESWMCRLGPAVFDYSHRGHQALASIAASPFSIEQVPLADRDLRLEYFDILESLKRGESVTREQFFLLYKECNRQLCILSECVPAYGLIDYNIASMNTDPCISRIEEHLDSKKFEMDNRVPSKICSP